MVAKPGNKTATPSWPDPYYILIKSNIQFPRSKGQQSAPAMLATYGVFAADTYHVWAGKSSSLHMEIGRYHHNSPQLINATSDREVKAYFF